MADRAQAKQGPPSSDRRVRRWAAFRAASRAVARAVAERRGARPFADLAEPVPGAQIRQRVTVAGKKNVGILTIEPVGNYAVRIVFDDTHDTGLYVWAYLRELGEHREARWQDYLQDLAAKKLTR